MMGKNLVVVGLILLGLAPLAESIFGRLKSRKITDLVYEKYQAWENQHKLSFCIRRFNSTHWFGCSSQKDGNVGRIFHVSHIQTLENLPRYPEAKILMIDILDFDSIKFLRNHLKDLQNHISGVILYQNKKFPADVSSYVGRGKSFSHDLQCPNLNYGYRNKLVEKQICKSAWIEGENPFQGIAFVQWPFPIFFVQNETLIKRLFRCETEQPRCLVQLQSFMYGAINSKRCLLRSHNNIDMIETSYCKPIQAKNLFSSLFPVKKQAILQNRSVLILAIRLDSFTMFDSLSPGANSVYSSLIVLVAVADLLNRHRTLLVNQTNGAITNVLYALFDGESFGYVGSNSWIFFNNYLKEYQNLSDASSSFDKFKLAKISSIIELNQLLTPGNTMKNFWLHGDWSLKPSNEFADHFQRFAQEHYPNALKIQKMIQRNDLPTSTLSQFHKYDPSIASFLLAGYGTKFSDPFYHSPFDLGQNYNLNTVVDQLFTVANLVGNFISKQITGENGIRNSLWETDRKLVHSLTECLFGLVRTCFLFNKTLKLTDIHFEYTTPMQRETELMINTIETKSRDKRIYRNVILKKTIRLILLYATGTRMPCKAIDKNDTELLIVPFGHNQIDFETVKLKKFKDCLAAQTFLDDFDSPYAAYLGKTGLEDHADLIKQLNMLENIDFSAWTESRYDSKGQPAIVLYIANYKSIEQLTLWLGVMIFLGSFVAIHFFKRYVRESGLLDFYRHESMGII